MSKSSTDLHWDQRALDEPDEAKVNIADTIQRDLELKFVFSQLPSEGLVLEVGCGNGYVTRQLRERGLRVDAFDQSENMIARARQGGGDFFQASVLDNLLSGYDTILCVRVLINLRNAIEQRQAIRNMTNWLKPGGKLILVEGFADGFIALNKLRRECDLPELTPASINCYSTLAMLMPLIKWSFTISAEFHTGMFDLLTRVVYPSLGEPANFHQQVATIARQFNPTALQHLARVRGFALIKKEN